MIISIILVVVSLIFYGVSIYYSQGKRDPIYFILQAIYITYISVFNVRISILEKGGIAMNIYLFELKMDFMSKDGFINSKSIPESVSSVAALSKKAAIDKYLNKKTTKLYGELWENKLREFGYSNFEYSTIEHSTGGIDVMELLSELSVENYLLYMTSKMIK